MKQITIFEILLVLVALREGWLLGLFLAVYIMMRHKDFESLQDDVSAMKRTLNNSIKEISDNAIRETEEKHGALTKELRQKMVDIEDQFISIIDAREDEEMSFKEPTTMPQRVIPHGNGFVIEDHGGYYLIKDPNMKTHPKVYFNIVEAQRMVESLASLFVYEKPKKSRVHNIRFVK